MRVHLFQAIVLIAVATFSSSQAMADYATEVLADGPAVYYRFDETSGTTVSDSSGNGLDSMYVGGITLGSVPAMSGIGGNSVLFDGTSGTIALPGTWGGTSQTVEAWVNTNTLDPDFQSIVSASNAGYTHLLIDSSDPPWGIGPGGLAGIWYTDGNRPDIVGSYNNLVADEWYHIALTTEAGAGKSRLYVNGSAIDCYIKDYGQYATIVDSVSVSIGSGWQGGRFFSGMMDEVAIYDTALSADRIAAHYVAAGGTAPTDPPAPEVRSIGLNMARGAGGSNWASGYLPTQGMSNSPDWGNRGVTGAVEQGHWNDIDNGNDSNLPDLMDNAREYTGASVSWTPAVGMGYAYADTDTERIFWAEMFGDILDVDFADIPYDEYDVYVYYHGNTAGVDQQFDVTVGGTTHTVLPGPIAAALDGSDEAVYYTRDFYEWTASDEASNYVKFAGLTGSTLNVHTGNGGGFSAIAAIQIVENGGTAVPGDFNDDGAVNVTDLGILATHYGTVGGADLSMGDANGDSNVDVTDLGILATYYGTTPSVAAPEPSMLCLLVLGTLALAWRRRK